MSHTPGPWRAIKAEVVSDAGGLVADAWTGTTGDYAELTPQDRVGFRHANARLIAAAPDLLAAAKTFFLCKDPADCSECINRFRSAIDKAEGRS